jgi:HPt (histidine-containing phosphotransfer) domain-containing protein
MRTSSTDVERELVKLRDAYVASLPDKFAELSDTYAAWKKQPDAACGEALHRRVHALTGGGATYGFARVSQAAGEFELALASVLKRGTAPSSEEIGALDALHGALLLQGSCAFALAAGRRAEQLGVRAPGLR